MSQKISISPFGSKKSKGVWWLTPSLLEPIDGPWGRMREDFGYDAVAAWNAILDWAVSMGLTHLVTGIEPFMSDRAVVQWPFHYICRFPEDPAARCFGEHDIEQNIQLAQAVCAGAIKRGLKILVHHYNFIAPERWVNAHDDLSRKLDSVEDPMWGWRFKADRMGFLVGHVCANDPAYRAFMERCWREMFANIPALAGLLLTAGEFSHCQCEVCSHGAKGSIFEEDYGQGARDPRLQTRLRFIEMARAVTTELERELIVRGWGMEQWLDHLPHDLVYATKSAVFDACLGGPDPNALKWSASGRKTWMMHTNESENSGPLVWHDEAWTRDVAGKLNAIDSPGTLVHINIHWGHKGHCSTFVSSRNIERVLQNLEPVVPSGKSGEEFDRFFGKDCGPAALEAAGLIATIPLEFTGIIHLDREGFSYHMQPWFDGNWRWPGVLGDRRYDPPAWANTRDLKTLTELMAEAETEPQRLNEILSSPGTVIHRCLELESAATRAMEILRDCRPPDGPARSEIHVLSLSASLARLLCRETAAVLKARVAWHLVRTQADREILHEARRLAVLHYSEAVEELRSQLNPARLMATHFPDYGVHVFTARETFFRLPLATKLKFRERELDLIRNAPLPITDEVMTLHHDLPR